VTGKAEQAKKDAETQAKKKVEGEGQKAIDDSQKEVWLLIAHLRFHLSKLF
jgi:hypothetical protein